MPKYNAKEVESNPLALIPALLIVGVVLGGLVWLNLEIWSNILDKI